MSPKKISIAAKKNQQNVDELSHHWQLIILGDESEFMSILARDRRTDNRFARHTGGTVGEAAAGPGQAAGGDAAAAGALGDGLPGGLDGAAQRAREVRAIRHLVLD